MDAMDHLGGLFHDVVLLFQDITLVSIKTN